MCLGEGLAVKSNVSLRSDKDQNVTVLFSQPPECDTANFFAVDNTVYLQWVLVLKKREG